MQLIVNTAGNEDSGFDAYLRRQLRQNILFTVNVKKLNAITHRLFQLKVIPVDMTGKQLILLLTRNIISYRRENKLVIGFDNKHLISTLNITPDRLCRTINFGMMGMLGYSIFTDAIKKTIHNVNKYYLVYAYFGDIL